MNARTRNALCIVTAALAFLYVMLFYMALHGYGYAGHGGFHVPASSWYSSQVEVYQERSNRSGSPGGSNLLGGGPESGK
ncbi:hypothetical protein EFQ99_12750 [Rhizobium vallis]|uniref:Uncharacterized protein n=1 Tax=Rhizobium vallis TaxID=634290 RepID=A0A432PP25_9HYPH|nr:hypothetical protein [Rhizobium vallis]RUM25601.1 hypothetical protein EFQ99_12750 [Rhizobium vallis]